MQSMKNQKNGSNNISMYCQIITSIYLKRQSVFLAGLLSAYHMKKDSILLEKAVKLGDALLVAFNTPTGIPHSDVNPAKKKASDPSWAKHSTSLSEGATVQLEFGYLSYLTNDDKYQTTVDKAQMATITTMNNTEEKLLRRWIYNDKPG
eukprot:UN30778